MLSKKKLIGLSLALTLTFSAFMLVKTLLFAPDKEVRIKTAERREENAAPEHAPEPPKPEKKEVPMQEEKIQGININSAGQEELESLPGIGPSLAEAIITYREENGYFEQKKEIMEVSGIGEAKFKAISELITLGD